ncbi:MAG: cytidylate kinase-like family protein [Deltaproteobacteria bacterium]|nr:cytidylate kinase-like family protein [Deltaproteobacteria bacterium]
MAVITLSRHFGAGGKTLGAMVAKKLGYVFLDDEIIKLVAEKAQSTDWMDALEKEFGGKLLPCISGLIPKGRIEMILDDKKGGVDEVISVDILQQLFLKIAEEGDAVIVGRGGQYLLRDHKDTFHVLLVADLEDRVQFMEERYNLSLKKALQVVNRQDKRRQNFYRLLGKVDYDQPDIYHLVLNMSKLSLMKACELLVTLVSGNVRSP